jgi:phosphoglycerol geranylgeranyltransferase
MQALEILRNFRNQGRKALAVLLDPDKENIRGLPSRIRQLADADPDFFFVGGSLITGNNFHLLIEAIRKTCSIPVLIFPGSGLHIFSDADGILLLSLISGRNAELLIGQHVVAAPFLKQSGLQILPTGYMLVDGGKPTTVSYMSNTQPIPADKPEIALCTAMAGEMLGLQLLYLDAGSGAQQAVPVEMIEAVRKGSTLPLLVGGGIRSAEQAKMAWRAGADCIVVGNALEKQPDLIGELGAARSSASMAGARFER